MNPHDSSDPLTDGGELPTVTIAVPVYNVARYVVECLESLAVLELPERSTIELLIIDDCSIDHSMRLVEAALPALPAAMKPRILRHDRNRGLAEARNTALKEARGEFLWFVDSDDRVEPMMLMHMLEAMEPEVDIVMTDVLMVAEDGVSVLGTRLPFTGDRRWTGAGALSEFYRRRIPAFMWNKLFRRVILDGVVFPAGLIYEDLAVIGTILLRARAVRYVDSADYRYRIRPGAITGALRPDVGDLITNVHHGVRDTLVLAPDVVPRRILDEFILREAYLPVLHAAARSGGHGKLEAAMYAEVRSRLSYRAALRSALSGRLPSAAAQLIARTSPRSYGAMYRLLRSMALT
ncbi:glycosyltransferase [Rathayibacter caricis]|uniref:glycosyltransferase family 2 protein n=1 Tax=Rathayibacter caricis TaxID=110936 RepID=UPI001FB32467|nr:glycosyltransferase family 2 protein [Rathayibacter caricis]MCJ1694905.1 glycosyltransferase [Rathayibacter caricis]